MRYCFLWRTRGQWSRRHSVYSSPGGNRHVGDTASFAAPDGNGHIDVSGMSRGVRYSGQACRISAYYDLLVAAISTVPVIATGNLAWQFALDGQKLRGILLLRLVLGPPARRQCIERRLPWNSGSTLCRCGCAPRDRHGGSASHRCSARAHAEVSATRMVPVRNRTP